MPDPIPEHDFDVWTPPPGRRRPGHLRRVLERYGAVVLPPAVLVVGVVGVLATADRALRGLRIQPTAALTAE